MSDKQTLGWRVVGGAGALVAGFAARRVITFAWKKATGKEPPTDPQDPKVGLAEAIGWAVVTGVGLEVTRLLVARATARQRLRMQELAAADGDP